ncbi:MAG: hypothetical protein M3169_02560 [Candidatus Eremiobacteraeota bacterium]|nr:hypothetical protein [Candidatus Eremiobacteraeota bacterium]
MVQAVLDMLSEALRSIASGAVPVAIAIAGIVVLGALVVVVVGVFDRDRVRWMFAAIPLALRPLGGWIVFAVALAGGVFVLHVVQLATDQRFVAMEYAQNTSGADSDATSMVQNAPRASFVSQKTYRRILTIPPYLLGRVSAEGVGVLAPYLTDPSAENVTRLVDSFRRSGRNVVFQRDATLQIETPIKLDASTVDANIELVDPTFGGRRTFYRASFDGKYVVHNATGREARVRFTFPLPTGSGTLSEVRFLADGKPITVTDLSNGYVWDGTLPQDGKTTFEIAYRNQGARGWAYRLSARREPIAKLDLAVHANRSPKFARYSLFPTTVSHGIAGGYTAEWHLENVVTAQDVGLVFARLDVRETLAKMLTYAPVALFVGIVFVAAYALRRRYHVTVAQATTAVAGYALGLALAGILTWYLPLVIGVVLGCIVAVVLALRALGRPFVLPIALATLTMLAFLFVTNTSLLLVADCTAALWTLVPMPGLDFVRDRLPRAKERPTP